MLKVFKEIDVIKELIEEETALKHKKEKYFEDAIQNSFKSMIEYVYMDTCLDYMDYTEYSTLIANNLKKILRELNKDLETTEKRISMLRDILMIKELDVVRLSILSREDLEKIKRMLSKEKINVQDADEVTIFKSTADGLKLSTFADESLSLEEILFIADYISAKNHNDGLGLEEFISQESKSRRNSI